MFFPVLVVQTICWPFLCIMMKRKERDVEGGEMSPKKPKGSGFIEGIDNDKAGNTMRVLKGLLQKEQTRLSG